MKDVFRDMTPFGSSKNGHIGGTYLLHLQNYNVSEEHIASIFRMKVRRKCSSEMPVLLTRATRHHITKQILLHYYV
jgi:hypothetical protein